MLPLHAILHSIKIDKMRSFATPSTSSAGTIAKRSLNPSHILRSSPKHRFTRPSATPTKQILSEKELASLLDSSDRIPSNPEKIAPRALVSAPDDRFFFTETSLGDIVQAMEVESLPTSLPLLLAELGIDYDPDRLAAALSDRTLDIASKGAQIALVFGEFLVKVLADMATNQVEANMRKRAIELRDAFAKLGPAFIKVGQALSSRPDLLPKPYLEILSSLQDRLPSFPTAIARQLIRDELGCEIDEIYSSFSNEAIAAASLGQVYQATLRSNNALVAVKVQRPGIADSIAIDILLLRRLVTFIDAQISPRVGLSQPLVPLVDEFAKKLFLELDYVQEGKNCEAFTALYGKMNKIKTPLIYWQGTRRRVLTMEWIDGVKLTDEAGMAKAGLNIIDFVDIGIECTLRQLLEQGLFHADPHPGNLLATKTGQLAYLDFGMMSTSPPSARTAIIAHVVHLVNRDYLAMTRDYYDLDFIDTSVDTTPIAPYLAAFFDDVLDKNVSQLNFKSIVDGLGETLFQFPLRVPAYYSLILRTLTVLEGLALQADPNYRLLAKAYPYMASRLLTDPSPALRSSLETLIMENGVLRWSRVENLLIESQKSMRFEGEGGGVEGMWLLVEWVFGERGGGMRRVAAQETVKMMDALIAGAWRKQAATWMGESSAINLIPESNGESEYRERFGMIWGALMVKGGVAPTPASSSSSSIPLPQGSGPFGTLTPLDIDRYIRSMNGLMKEASPHVQRIISMPGAVQFTGEVFQGLMVRATARSVQLWARGGAMSALVGGRGGEKEERVKA